MARESRTVANVQQEVVVSAETNPCYCNTSRGTHNSTRDDQLSVVCARFWNLRLPSEKAKQNTQSDFLALLIYSSNQVIIMNANTSMQRRSSRVRKPLLMKANEQYCLDFGQKNIDPIRCSTCGMLYVPGEESDEKQHARYHAEFDEGVRWTAKLEKPRKYYDSGCRIVAIDLQEQKPVLDAVNKLLKMSEADMSPGDDVTKLLSKEKTLFLVYITKTNHIVGYIYVEEIEEANNLVDFNSSRLESDPVRADCGVMYLWVHPTYRRQGIATKLTDIARANIKKTSIVFRSRVAVCEPSEIAIPFFSAYLRNKRPVKVYQQNL